MGGCENSPGFDCLWQQNVPRKTRMGLVIPVLDQCPMSGCSSSPKYIYICRSTFLKIVR